MKPEEAATAATKILDLFHGVEPEHVAHWTREFKGDGYVFELVSKAIDQLRTVVNYFDPERFHAIHRRIRMESRESEIELRKSKDLVDEFHVQKWWSECDAVIAAMTDEEFYSLAVIALSELPAHIRAAFEKRGLRTIKSIRGRVYQLSKAEQPA